MEEERWSSIFTPSGDWLCWSVISNGWTAWVVDSSGPSDGITEYSIYATAGAMKKTTGFKVLRLATAKSMALSLALSQPPRVCFTERIGV